MTDVLDIDFSEEYESQDISEISLENISIDNWLDSGYRLVIPEKEYWSSDDY